MIITIQDHKSPFLVKIITLSFVKLQMAEGDNIIMSQQDNAENHDNNYINYVFMSTL